MRFWDKDRKQDNRKNIWIEHLNIDTGNWFQVFSACLGKMIAIQTACSEQVVKGQDWNVDFSEGVILFGNQKYPLQFIGSEATSSNTWLWGWENINGFSEKIIQVATHAKVVGERWNLEPLTTAEFTPPTSSAPTRYRSYCPGDSAFSGLSVSCTAGSSCQTRYG